ncbi:MAG: non-heme iron oxygenase ferredoxin subunit [Dehalococcoidia bacterium]
MLNEFVKVAKVSEIKDNTMVSVSAGGEDILLAKVEGEIFAIDDWCTHAAGMLSMGILHADTCEVECPIHEGYFDLRTGDATAPPAEEPVVSYEVHVEGDDVLVGPKQ